MKGFWEIFFELFLSWWWLILTIVSSPYLYYLIFMRKRNFHPQEVKNIDAREEFFNPKTEEEKYLGINILKSELPMYKKRIDALVESLRNSTDRVIVSAVEAMLLVEYFSKDVMVNENGELVIDLKTRDYFCEKIYDNPMAFITYVKAVENKIDIEKKENKIEFNTILYMMRNARKFGLYLDPKDTDFTLKIKSAIHQSDYKDVVLNIVDNAIDEAIIESTPNEFVLINTNEKFNSVQQYQDNTFKSVEKIDGNKVKIITNDNYEIIKDNTQVYSFGKIEDDENSTAIEIDRANLQKTEDVSRQIYMQKFGPLDRIEIKTGILRDRCKFHFEDQIANSVDFDINGNSNDDQKDFYFFEDAETYRYFLAYLFDNRFSIGVDSCYIFYGERDLKTKTIKFLSIDIYYLFSLLYASLRRNHRENFFKYIFNDDFTINTKNANAFLENFNKSAELFLENNMSGFLAYAVHRINSKDIKSLVARVDLEAIVKLLNMRDDSADAFARQYMDYKKSIGSSCHSVSFGAQAEKDTAHITIGHDAFFRVPKNEAITKIAGDER